MSGSFHNDTAVDNNNSTSDAAGHNYSDM